MIKLDVINIQIQNNLSLKLNFVPVYRDTYPSKVIQKGLLLFDHGEALSEEGVGFGVPIIKQGVHTFFPGKVELHKLSEGKNFDVSVVFFINLEEKIGKPGKTVVNNTTIYRIKDSLAGLYRRFKYLRNLLGLISTTGRSMLGWETTYEQTPHCWKIKVTYSICPESGVVWISLDSRNELLDGVTEVVMMNEQGANFFDLYQESGGISLQGDQICPWDKLTGETGSFVSSSRRVGYRVRQVKGSELYRGRELVESRLAWSGFGYSIPPELRLFNYDIQINRIP